MNACQRTAEGMGRDRNQFRLRRRTGKADYDVECVRTQYPEYKGHELERLFGDLFLSREWENVRET